MDRLTIHEAAETTGWSPRMLRYVERAGLIEPQLAAALDAWFSAMPTRPADEPSPGAGSAAPDDDWLAFEQVKHQQLLTSDRQDTA